MSRRLKTLVTTLILIAAGCDDDPTDQIDTSIHQVVVNASATQIEAGQLVMATAVARQADGTVRTVDLIWAVSDTAIASIAAQQQNSVLVRGKRAGIVTISAKAEQRIGSVDVNVTAAPIANPLPKLQVLEPAASTEGSTGVVLRVKGEDFTPATYVQWNAVAKQTTFVSSTELTVIVTPLDVAAAGEAQVRVITPGPGGGVTQALTFTIYGKPVSIQLQQTFPWPEIFLPGEEALIGAVVKDRFGRTLPGLQLNWASATAATATVDNNGKVKMVGPGQARITVRADTVIAEAYVNVAADPGADVIYDAEQDGVRQLFITRPHIAGRQKLIAGTVHGVQPAPAPNGQKIAFVGTGTNGSTDIYVVNRDGTGLKQLTTSAYEDDQPVWSPDGQRIAFRTTRHFGYSEVWVMNADGSAQESLTRDEIQVGLNGYEHPTWSPDGQYLVFAYTNFGMTPRLSTLFRYRFSDGSRTLIPQTGLLSQAEPAFGNSNTMLVLRRTFANSLGDQIAFMNPMTGETWIYLDYPGYGRNPALSFDNKWVAFESTPRDIASVTGVYINWVGTFYRRVIGAGNAAGNPANPAWLTR